MRIWRRNRVEHTARADSEPPDPSPADIKKRLRRTGELENGGVDETVLPDGEVQGGEHLRAAEGAMTFRAFTDEADPNGDTGAWMAEELSSIEKETARQRRLARLKLPGSSRRS